MSGVEKMLTRGGAAIAVLAGLAACGVEATSSPVKAELELPGARDARITVTPALDVSGLYDASLADRIVLEEVTINLADARLLGADPRIPAGGLGLLSEPAVVSAFGGDEAGILLPFPGYLLAEEDLAVYVRIDQSAALEGSSVLIRGRIYEHAAAGGQSPLTASPDPDGDPARGRPETGDDFKHAESPEEALARAGREQGIDPDGDPARPCAPDPDGDPARPACPLRARSALVQRTDNQNSAPFVLRGADVADLVAHLDAASQLDVVVGVPAARWFTPETVAQLDRVLSGAPALPGTEGPRDSTHTPVVVQARTEEDASQRLDDDGGYFITDDEALGRMEVRRGD